MSARFVALLITAVSLGACGTTGPTTTAAPSEPESASPPPAAPSRLVVRGPIVPDDEDMAPVAAPAAKTVRPSKRVAMADAASAPEIEEPVVEKVEKPKPAPKKPASKPGDSAVVVPPASSGSGGSGGGSSAGGSSGGGSSTAPSTPAAPGDTPATPPSSSASTDVTAVPLSDPAEPPSTVTAEPAGAVPPKPSPFAVDFKDMINTTVAGFPLWLMVLVGILLAAALVFGVGGAKRQRPRVEPAREEHTYAARDEEEAVPA